MRVEKRWDELRIGVKCRKDVSRVSAVLLISPRSCLPMTAIVLSSFFVNSFPML